MDELISVIINVYNAEKYIKKCLESVLKQTYTNLEIIIVNDGSTDGTLEICENYADNRIRIINQNNMGLSLSRNVGINNSKGKYLYFVDSDDFIEEDTIEYLYNLVKKYNAKIATCNPLDIYDYSFVKKNQIEEISLLSKEDMLKMVLLVENRAGTIWNKLIKREMFDNLRFENRIINDVVVVYKLVLKADVIVYSNQIKYYYLHHSDSILGRKNVEHSIDLYKACIERYKYIKNIYPDFIENEICIMSVIMILYLQQNKKLQDFLKEANALGIFKKMFTFKILTCKMKLKEKIKILLFRISPIIYKKIINMYLMLKKHWRRCKNKNGDCNIYEN